MQWPGLSANCIARPQLRLLPTAPEDKTAALHVDSGADEVRPNFRDVREVVDGGPGPADASGWLAPAGASRGRRSGRDCAARAFPSRARFRLIGAGGAAHLPVPPSQPEILTTLLSMSAMSKEDRRGARPVAVVAATAAWVISAVVNDLSGWSFALTATAGAVLTALAVGLPLRAERRAAARAVTAEQIAEDAAAQMQLVLQDALEPLAYLIGRITDRPRWSRGRELLELQGQAKAVVLAAAAEVLGADRLRACYFALTDDRPARLVPAGFHGRAEAPRSTFVAGTPLGDYAMQLLARGEDLFCPDTHNSPLPGWQPGGHEYRTFIAAPVATEEKAFGIITIDGLQVGDLTEADVAAVRVFARLLAIALNA